MERIDMSGGARNAVAEMTAGCRRDTCPVLESTRRRPPEHLCYGAGTWEDQLTWGIWADRARAAQEDCAAHMPPDDTLGNPKLLERLVAELRAETEILEDLALAARVLPEHDYTIQLCVTPQDRTDDVVAFIQQARPAVVLRMMSVLRAALDAATAPEHERSAALIQLCLSLDCDSPHHVA